MRSPNSASNFSPLLCILVCASKAASIGLPLMLITEEVCDDIAEGDAAVVGVIG